MSDDMTHRLHALIHAVEDVLVASNGLTADFRRVHENRREVPAPFVNKQGDLSEVEKLETANVVALKQYGPGGLFNLWCALRAISTLKQVWTGVTDAPDPAPPVAPAAAPP